MANKLNIGCGLYRTHAICHFVVLGQWCSNRGPRATCGPRSNFHWKENL